MSGRRSIMLAAVLVLAACGGGETTDTAEPATPDVTASDTTEPHADTVPAEDLEDASSLAPELIGIEWNVVNIGLVGALTNVWPDTEITLVFDSASSLSGFSGCNDYAASYEVEGGYREEADPFDDLKGKGQVIRITDISADEAACEDKVMEQESDYFKDLTDSDRWYISDGTLKLVSNDAGLRVDAEPVA